MAKKNFYVVRSGRQTGIFPTWAECKAQVDGYQNADYKGFATLDEAEAYLGLKPADAPPPQAAEEIKPRAAPAQSQPALPMPKPAAGRGLRQVTIYTDGACTGNPGPGGYGAVLLYDGEREELSGGFRRTTNNRMEILACVVALRALAGRCAVTLHSDSKYVVNTMEKGWARRWRSADWKRKEGYGETAVWKEALNADLWEQMLALCDQHKVAFVWVRGHAGDVENERCDQLARQAILDGDLRIDAFYEDKSQP
ncbi:MAG: ribonuclease HI [Blastocatellia bacterium]